MPPFKLKAMQWDLLMISCRSLNLGPEKSELPEILSTIDPLNTGFVEFVPFLSYAAIAMHSKDAESEAEDDDDEDEYNDAPSNMAEVQAAYNLFTHGGAGPRVYTTMTQGPREFTRKRLGDR